ncbi:sperm-egg fusion protein Juno isoform X3 [Peromyscus californicus insignis]|nr:sperm-egg fusion protein Juno isoform X3 [Peromyscus californicus insignis]XP_052608601.1 sperm-egg fusion protein Juno isoform X3 [Peromyscus californicus insignis]XP_052608610.1 sperm-egg fusion protein Juno isoform X3 [Peromyscus californicus insignis]
MAQWWQMLLGLWTVMPTLAGDKPVNICMNDKHHKREPGPEDKLFLECMPWRASACCTLATSWEAHLEESSFFNFSMTHCGLLTPACHKHFIQAICFHECSPNLEPWIQPVVPDRQEERVWGVPLCREDCEEWWKDCQSSYTCKSDWNSGWDWSQDSPVSQVSLELDGLHLLALPPPSCSWDYTLSPLPLVSCCARSYQGSYTPGSTLPTVPIPAPLPLPHCHGAVVLNSGPLSSELTFPLSDTVFSPS